MPRGLVATRVAGSAGRARPLSFAAQKLVRVLKQTKSCVCLLTCNFAFSVTPYGNYAGWWTPYVVVAAGVAAGFLVGILLCLLWQLLWRVATSGCNCRKAFPNCCVKPHKVSIKIGAGLTMLA